MSIQYEVQDGIPKEAAKRGRPRGSSVLSKLTPERWAELLNYIRLGAYDYIAAASLGVHPNTFYKWMRKGELARSGLYREFYLGVTQASAEARRNSEIIVRADDPKFWLSRGPGKSRPGLPGWTEEVAVDVQGSVDVTRTGKHPIAPLSTLAEAFAILEDLGYFKRTKAGETLFRSLPSPEDGDGTGDGDGETEVIDEQNPLPGEPDSPEVPR